MKIGIYDPYLDTLGGGERYIFEIAKYLSLNNEVSIFWNDTSILRKVEERFGIVIENIRFENNIFSAQTPFSSRLIKTFSYDVIIYVSDGSIPPLFSKKNILLFQYPVNWVNNNLWYKLKLKRFNNVICYSDFVKKYIDSKLAINSTVLPPSVDLIDAKNSTKENIILTVGRFTEGLNNKKHDVMIEFFKEMFDGGFKDWELILIGSILPENKSFVKKLRGMAKGYPIKILENISNKEIKEYYRKAKIYWHAAGFDEDLEKYPERAEHFGISTVEAMSAGVVPVVFNAGGQKEIVVNEESGFLWNKREELIEKTIDLTKDKNLLLKLSRAASDHAKIFGRDKFYERLKNLVVDL